MEVGKSVYVRYLVNQFEQKNYKTYYFDPKFEFESNTPYTEVFYTKGLILKSLREINSIIDTRGRKRPKKEFEQIFVILEEMAAFKATLNNDELKEFNMYFENILLKGRSLKVTIIVVSQIVDSTLFGSSGLREQFNVKVSLGDITTTRCKMLFDCPKKDLPPKSNMIGSGYIYINGKIYSYIAPRLSEKGEPALEKKGSGTFAKRLKGAINR